jgi:hypothetical protein
MSLLTRAGDLEYTFRFLRLLTTPFKETTAFKLGIIDDKGKRVKSVPLDTSEKKSAYNTFHRLAFNIKKLLGSSTPASYAAALFLLKEKYHITEPNIQKILQTHHLEVLDLLDEQTNWFILPDSILTPGIYRIKSDKMVNQTCEEIAYEGDKVRVQEQALPVGDMFGIPVYEAIHMATNQAIYVTAGELVR